ncbi:cytochrome P450 [Amycolatopsis vastitatis]|uniref:Cytochrome P450 n=1 Tax=Amycolatopsis vastitatis TaxID=1905142 RepID=A0A229SZZ2_9PSEU|nr:cytochrome P450 [Amycolatopsis vastitatis]OXM64049.1 cytochrome P450 [Amycolatopsis vastitatis]
MSAPELPMPRACPFQPPDGYAALRAEGPLARARLRDGSPVWAVTGYEQVRALLAHPAVSSDVLNPHHPELSLPPGASRPDPEQRRPVLTFVEMDDPEHARLRRMVIPYFSVRRTRALRPHIQSTVDNLLDAVIANGPETDLMAGLAVPLPALALCEVFGVPAADRAFFAANMTWPMQDIDQVGASFKVLRNRIEQLLRDKRDAPADDLLSGLARQVAAGALTERQALGTVFMLIIAGHETTANTLALAVLTLLSHPDEVARLHTDPTAAVDELLRYVTVADPVCRVATADVEIGGRSVKAGDGIVVLLAAANRDREAMADADRLDLRRRPNRHLAFGHGVHQCLGHLLARTEIEVALTSLFTRLPTLRLAGPADGLPVKPALSLQGVTRLPITW